MRDIQTKLAENVSLGIRWFGAQNRSTQLIPFPNPRIRNVMVLVSLVEFILYISARVQTISIKSSENISLPKIWFGASKGSIPTTSRYIMNMFICIVLIFFMMYILANKWGILIKITIYNILPRAWVNLMPKFVAIGVQLRRITEPHFISNVFSKKLCRFPKIFHN